MKIRCLLSQPLVSPSYATPYSMQVGVDVAMLNYNNFKLAKHAFNALYEYDEHNKFPGHFQSTTKKSGQISQPSTVF